jgi:hypothetical protein
VGAIPEEWKETLDQWEYCDELLGSLPLFRGGR